MKKILLILFVIINLNSKLLFSHPINNITNNIDSFGTLEIYAQASLKTSILCNPILQSCKDNKLITLISVNSLLKETPVLKASSVCIDIKKNKSIFITANHVCTEISDAQKSNNSFENNKKIIIKNILNLNSLITESNLSIKFFVHIKDINENLYQITKIIKMMPEFDLCLLEVKNKFRQKSKISQVNPKSGDKIYNIAAPEGIQFKGALPILTGVFSGEYESRQDANSYLLSLPASQGSSGSPVFNEKGELIGIIYAAFKNFSHLSISSTLDQIKVLIK